MKNGKKKRPSAVPKVYCAIRLPLTLARNVQREAARRRVSFTRVVEDRVTAGEINAELVKQLLQHIGAVV